MAVRTEAEFRQDITNLIRIGVAGNVSAQDIITLLTNAADSMPFDADLANLATAQSVTNLMNALNALSIPATTDDLAEGVNNLYFTAAKALAAAPAETAATLLPLFNNAVIDNTDPDNPKVTINTTPLPDSVIQFKGVWATNTAYAVNDVVVDANMAFWLAKRAIAADPNNVTPVAGADWRAWGGASAGGGGVEYSLVHSPQNVNVQDTDILYDTGLDFGADADIDNSTEYHFWDGLSGVTNQGLGYYLGMTTGEVVKRVTSYAPGYDYVNEDDDGDDRQAVVIGRGGHGVSVISIFKGNDGSVLYKANNTTSDGDARPLWMATYKFGAGGGGQQPPTQYDAPSITDFSIAGQDPSSPPHSGDALGGDLNVSFTINNPENVAGNLSLSRATGNAAAVVLANNIDPNDADGNVVVAGTDALAAVAGTSYTYRLFGTDTQNPAETFESEFTITIPVDQDYVYLNNQATGGMAGAQAFSTNGATRAIFSSDPQRIVSPAAANNAYLAYAQRATDPDLTEIRISNFNQIGAFTKYPNAVMIGGVQYDVWLSDNLLLADAINTEPIEFVK